MKERLSKLLTVKSIVTIALTNGLYYVQGYVIYRCKRDTGVPVYHALADLTGVYVELA